MLNKCRFCRILYIKKPNFLHIFKMKRTSMSKKLVTYNVIFLVFWELIFDNGKQNVLCLKHNSWFRKLTVTE